MNLRIAINGKKVDGPYGGGNQFSILLEEYLRDHGHYVVRSLVHGLDLILIVSSQYHPKTTSFPVTSIQDYRVLNPRTAIVQRVNSSDEPRGQDLGVNRSILETNSLVDHTIFVSNFIKESFGLKGMDLNRPHSTILNGADERKFNPTGGSTWLPGQKLRFVTHHWSSNYLKGFDVYERLDLLLAEQPYRDLIEFEIIGNLPFGLHLKQTRIIPPLYGSLLADQLKRSHMYITAARYEAGSMHNVEGMMCGLPVLYLNSGALPEYCQPYGIEFNLANFEEKLKEAIQKYPVLKQSLTSCPYKGTWMAQKYEDVFLNLVEKKRSLPVKNPSLFQRMRTQLVNRPLRNAQRIQAFLTRIWQVTKN